MRELSAESPLWYVLRAETGRELTARDHLGHRDFETYLPTYSYRTQHHAARTKALLPGYLFARFDDERRRDAIVAPAVIGILMFGETPATMSDAEIAQMRLLEQMRNARPEPTFPTGSTVRIRVAGAEVEGVIVHSDDDAGDKRRLVVMIQMLGRAVSIPCEREQLFLAA